MITSASKFRRRFIYVKVFVIVYIFGSLVNVGKAFSSFNSLLTKIFCADLNLVPKRISVASRKLSHLNESGNSDDSDTSDGFFDGYDQFLKSIENDAKNSKQNDESRNEIYKGSRMRSKKNMFVSRRNVRHKGGYESRNGSILQ